jgi:lysine 6-dehydrogenase
MSFTYAVLGAGRQGTAAAYDMARWGDAGKVILADQRLEAARTACERVDRLLGRPVSEPREIDVRNGAAVEALLNDVDALLSAVPYFFNHEITRAALRAKAHMCDLGGHLGISLDQHRMSDEAKEAGVAVVPNCGQVPGMGTALMVHAMELLDGPEEVFMWDGGIPQNPRPPFNYLLTFHMAGLTNEYAQPGTFLRDGKIVDVEPMTELEVVDFPEPIGRLEAFVAGGGTDSMPWTFEGKLKTLQNKTLRHPGHFAQLRAFYDLGLWSEEPVRAGAVEVAPRDVFHALFEPKVTFPDDPDRVIVRVRATGKKSGQKAESFVELIDVYDEVTGFTAMERTTGFSGAIVAAMMARGEIAPGAGGVERMVPAGLFVEELRRRGFSVEERVTMS